MLTNQWGPEEDLPAGTGTDHHLPADTGALDRARAQLTALIGSVNALDSIHRS